MDFYLSIRHDRVAIEDQHDKKVTMVSTPEEYNEYFKAKADERGVRIDDLLIVSSSALDFPEEYTDSATAIALCEALRGN